MNYAGIDYGMGSTNIDLETGIRYGIVSMNSLDEWAWQTMQGGDDLDFIEYRESVRDDMSSAIERVLEEHGLIQRNYGADNFADDIVDNLEFDNYESNGDCVRYELKDDLYHLQTTSDGQLFVFKSPYYTQAQFCSPCVPGAGNLDCPCESGPKTYCLDASWFDDDVAPYPVYRCDTGELVVAPIQEEK